MFTCGLLRSNFSFAISSSAPQSKSCKTLETRNLLPPAGLLDNFLSQIVRKFRVMRKMHCESGAALRAAAQVRGVTEHLRERHFHANDIAARPVFGALNRRTPRIQVAEHLRHILFRR